MLKPAVISMTGHADVLLHCNTVNSCFFSKHFARLVGAPLVGALHKGTHEGCPYVTCLVAAKGRAALPNENQNVG